MLVPGTWCTVPPGAVSYAGLGYGVPVYQFTVPFTIPLHLVCGELCWCSVPPGEPCWTDIWYGAWCTSVLVYCALYCPTWYSELGWPGVLPPGTILYGAVYHLVHCTWSSLVYGTVGVWCTGVVDVFWDKALFIHTYTYIVQGMVCT